ncbi:hypothetical protein ACLG6S_15485 [Thermodesulfobacteriota bacterium B35]
MAGRRRRTHGAAVSALNRTLRRPDLSILGNGIRHLPPAQWQDRMFFQGVDDTDLRHHTRDRFPATLRPHMDTHPVFVLQARPEGHFICPCSSRGDRNTDWYIRKGCCLEMTGHVMGRDSFLIYRCAFTLPLDSRFSRKLRFRGIVPENCVCGGRP